MENEIMQKIIKNAAISGKYKIGHHPFNGKTYLLCDISVGDIDSNEWLDTIRFTFDVNNWNSEEFFKKVIEQLEQKIECTPKVKKTALIMLNDFYNHYKANNIRKGE
jgi:hypothetical protein